MKHLQKACLTVALALCYCSNYAQNGTPKKNPYAVYVEASAIYYKNLELIRERVLPSYLGWLPDNMIKTQNVFFETLNIHPDTITNYPKIQEKTLKELNKTNKFYYCGDHMPPFLRGYLASSLQASDFIKLAKSSLSGYAYWTDCATGTFSTAIEHFFCHEKAEGIVSWNRSILPLLAVLNNLGHSTTLMANTNKNCMDYLVDKYAEDLAYFNQKEIVSGKNGFFSTDPELWTKHSLEQKKQTIIITGEQEHVKEYINCGIPKEQCIVVDPEDKEQDTNIAKKLEKLGIDLSYTKEK